MQPWDDPDKAPPTDAGRLRELLGYMKVPAEHIAELDLVWVAGNLSRWSAHGCYVEARTLCARMLAADKPSSRRAARLRRS